MSPEDAARYRACASRDPRFDGIFYIGVTSTGIYCRPVCTARTPRPENCRFFESAALAEKARFRPCLRCRPELAPGRAPVDGGLRIAKRVLNLIQEGLLDEEGGMESLAARIGLSSRQIRRIVRSECGVSPVELVMTRRLLLAKQLLTETTLPIIEVAFASGFSSLRRFNDAFRDRYAMPPSRLRKEAGSDKRAHAETLTLRLSYRPPYDWAGLLSFIGARALNGVECVRDGSYSRTVELGGRRGWFQIRHAPHEQGLLVELSHSLTPVIPLLLGRLRSLFDLDARPDIIAAHLVQDPLLADAVTKNPGLRVPGGFEGFELAVRAVLGQQISVKGATTVAGRYAEAFGEPIDTPYPGLTRLIPTPERIARADVQELAALGVTTARARCIIALAAEVAAGRIRLSSGADPLEVIKQLTALPGIGDWTAHYIAMRALRWPDAFPHEDLGLRNSLGRIGASQVEELSQAWRPWRSYAALYLWRTPLGP